MMRWYARRTLVPAFPLTMLVMPANAALMRTSTPDAFNSVPTQPRKLVRVCITSGWSMTLVQRRGSFHWTRHAVWYSWRSTVMWVHPKTIESLLEIHKRSYYSVGVSRRWVDHLSEHNQCIRLLGRACHQAVLLSIDWPVVPVDLRLLSGSWKWKAWDKNIQLTVEWLTYNRSIELICSWFYVKFDLWPLIWPWF